MEECERAIISQALQQVASALALASSEQERTSKILKKACDQCLSVIQDISSPTSTPSRGSPASSGPSNTTSLGTIDIWMPAKGVTSTQLSQGLFGHTWIGRVPITGIVNLQNGCIIDIMIDVLCARKLATALTTEANQGPLPIKLELTLDSSRISSLSIFERSRPTSAGTPG